MPVVDAMRQTITALVLSFVIAFAGVAFSFAPDSAVAKKSVDISLQHAGTYHSGVFGGAAEIVAHDPKTQRLFVVNAQAASIDVLDISDITAPSKIMTIDVSPYGAGVNSVAVHNKVLVAAVENENKTSPGSAVFFDTNGNFLNAVTVGALPDMITFTPNGDYVLVANEGEPEDYCAPGLENDPEGSVSIIDVRKNIKHLTQADVRTAGFAQFNETAIDPSVRIYGPNASVAQDLEPEYIAVSDDSKTAFVTLQENNAIAIIDIKNATVTDLVGLGFKDHNIAGMGLDASDRDGRINIANWPVKGLYEPDSIGTFKSNGKTYLATANEGDLREYDCYVEESRVSGMSLDPAAFPDAATLKANVNIGRLTATTATGDTDRDGDFDEIHVPGTRSFSIWTESGSLVFDSGDAFEQITAAELPAFFNANNDANGAGTFDSRSDNKGPEPEALAIGEIKGRTFAFVGLERIGGIVVYDVTEPSSPQFVQYVNRRDFTAPIDSPAAGDLGPEGIIFVPQSESPTKNPLLVVGNEISGTTSIYEILAD
jgi:DNA-binding beta-propeller fold protein YncE